MPFADEPLAHRVEVVPYQARWASEGEALVARLALLVPTAVAIDHIGSTAVPGLPAKDCLDVMIRTPGAHDRVRRGHHPHGCWRATSLRAPMSSCHHSAKRSWNVARGSP
jgi:GrpB-like predicted nucleotidyltransferase (UPF0157 family)